MWFEFQQLSSVLWIMVTPQGQSYHPERTVSSRFVAYRPPPLPVRGPHAPELNGDDRMVAEPEQSHRPPNSPHSLSRQATSFYVTVIDRSITSNTITHPVPICHDLSTFGFPCTSSITLMAGIYNRNSYGISVSGLFLTNAKRRVPPARSAGGTRLAATSLDLSHRAGGRSGVWFLRRPPVGGIWGGEAPPCRGVQGGRPPTKTN